MLDTTTLITNKRMGMQTIRDIFKTYKFVLHLKEALFNIFQYSNAPFDRPLSSKFNPRFYRIYRRLYVYDFLVLH